MWFMCQVSIAGAQGNVYASEKRTDLYVFRLLDENGLETGKETEFLESELESDVAELFSSLRRSTDPRRFLRSK